MAEEKKKNDRVSFNLVMPEEVHKKLQSVSDKTGIPMTKILIVGGLRYADELMQLFYPDNVENENG